VVGHVNDGWNVSLTTFGFERGSAFANHQIALAATVEKLFEVAREVAGPTVCAVQSSTTRPRSSSARPRGGRGVARDDLPECVARSGPGSARPEGNIIALYFGELAKRVHVFALEMLGPAGLEKPDEGREWVTEYLDAFKQTIAGGTAELRRHVIGERLLGLPRGRSA
jgi:alkylation response protein AidB-like acyl-CoA dehydrogenase